MGVPPRRSWNFSIFPEFGVFWKCRPGSPNSDQEEFGLFLSVGEPSSGIPKHGVFGEFLHSKPGSPSGEFQNGIYACAYTGSLSGEQREKPCMENYLLEGPLKGVPLGSGDPRGTSP